jgi:arylsulfatase A-like enzyme
MSKKLNGHKPAGLLRGGKYSTFDAGTRLPFIVRWPGHVKPGVSKALVSQVDVLASFAALTGQSLSKTEAWDSFNTLDAFLRKSQKSHDYVIEPTIGGNLSLIRGNWKYLEPQEGVKVMKEVNIEMGNGLQPQLYDLKTDLGETKNVAGQYSKIVAELAMLLKSVREKEGSK